MCSSLSSVLRWPALLALLFAVACHASLQFYTLLRIRYFNSSYILASPLRFALCFNDEKQEGASKEDIEQLTKFKFRKVGGHVNKHGGDDEAQGNTEGIMTECGTDSPVEHTLLQEDAVSIQTIHSSHLTNQILDRLRFSDSCDYAHL